MVRCAGPVCGTDIAHGTTGEAQKIDRMMEKFAERSAISLRVCYTMYGTDIAYEAMCYATAIAYGDASGSDTMYGAASYAMCGTDVAYGGARFCKDTNAFSNADTAYVLAYSIIMLNTDAHSPKVFIAASAMSGTDIWKVCYVPTITHFALSGTESGHAAPK
eukprot:2096295-Rhodomonas_salina.6